MTENMNRLYMSKREDLRMALHDICNAKIEENILNLKSNLNSVIDSRNNETKSSAGDKYETSRAMMQMEEDRIRNQLSIALQMKTELSQIKKSTSTPLVNLGSVVITKQAKYYISVGIGKVSYNDERYYCISKNSPIGKLLLNKAAGDTITFNNKQIEITDII